MHIIAMAQNQIGPGGKELDRDRHWFLVTPDIELD